MQQKIKYRLVFNRRKKLNKNGEALIQIEAYLNRKRKYFSTGIYIKPTEWDSKKEIINRKHSKFIELNHIIKQQIKTLEESELQLINRGEEIDLNKLNIKNDSNFWQVFDKYIANKNVSKSRKKVIERAKRYLHEFDSSINFNNFDYKKIMEFDMFLKTKKGLAINSIAVMQKVINSFLNYCLKADIIDKNPYIKFRIKEVRTERVFLTPDEIKSIENIDEESLTKSLIEVKDIFLFSCYTGLRFSDIQQLKPEMFDFTNNEVYLNLKQQKTNKIQRLPLHLLFDGKAIPILNRYLDTKKQYIFSRNTNQNINRLLKVIQAIAGIKKTLTFHVSRHSFGTELARLTNDPYLIKELMGHSDIATSMIYIHINNKDINDKLKNTKW